MLLSFRDEFDLFRSRDRVKANCRLLQEVSNYPYRDVFVVVNCLEDYRDEKRYLDKVVRLKLSKLYPELRVCRKEESFCFEMIDNTIKSGKIPFYYTPASPQEILDQ